MQWCEAPSPCRAAQRTVSQRVSGLVHALGDAGLHELDRGSLRRGCHAEDEARRHALDHGGRERLQRAGKPSIRGVVTKVKGVWTEIVHTLGLQSWSHLFHPCFKCHSGRPRRDRRCKSGIAPVRCDDCDDACAICFIRPEDARTSHRHVEE